jgi:DNA-directed RNA polymerase subunit RPC12/RpoP
MSYISPQPYKCVKCDHEFEHSPHHAHPAPVLQKEVQSERGTHSQAMPVCPRCWAKFLLENIGIGYNTQKWRPEGSDYQIEKEKNNG